MNLYQLKNGSYVAASNAGDLEAWLGEKGMTFEIIKLVTSQLKVARVNYKDEMAIGKDFSRYCEFAGTSCRSIRMKSRTKKLVSQRRAVAHCLREDGYSFSEIGDMFYRDHTSIINLLKRKDRLTIDCLSARESAL